MQKKLATAALAVSLGGCVIGPQDGWSYSSRSSTISFVGYASESEADVVIQCRVVSTGAWTDIGGDTADVSPGNPTHEDPLFQFYDTVVIPNNCWQSQGEFGYRARVRVREPDAAYIKTLYTFDEDGILCLNAELASGEEWVPAGSVCASGSELTLYANS